MPDARSGRVTRAGDRVIKYSTFYIWPPPPCRLWYRGLFMTSGVLRFSEHIYGSAIQVLNFAVYWPLKFEHDCVPHSKRALGLQNRSSFGPNSTRPAQILHGRMLALHAGPKVLGTVASNLKGGEAKRGGFDAPTCLAHAPRSCRGPLSCEAPICARDAREQRPHCPPETPRVWVPQPRYLELVTASHWYARTACTRGRESLAAGVDACLARSLVGC